MRAVTGQNHVSTPNEKSQPRYKYVITAERNGEIDSILSAGLNTGVAHFANKYGPYAFSSYMFGGYLNGRRVNHDSELVALFIIPTKKGDLNISVQINPTYTGNTY